MGRAGAEFQDEGGEAALAELRGREWRALQRSPAGEAGEELREIRLDLVDALCAAGRESAAARLAAHLLASEPPPDPLARLRLLSLAGAIGTPSELDARCASFSASGLLDPAVRLDLAEAWLDRGDAAASDRVLAPFRAGAMDGSGEAAALRARAALARGRTFAAEALLARIAEMPARAKQRGASALLAGAENAYAAGRLDRAASFERAIAPELCRSDDERMRLEVLSAARARLRGELAPARALAALDLASAAPRTRARAALEIARAAVEQRELALAEAEIARAAGHFGVEADLEPELWSVRGALALARGDQAGSRAAFERALERGRWCGCDAAGEALEALAAQIASGAIPNAGAIEAEWFGLPHPLRPGLAVEVVLRGPRRAFLATWTENALSMRELDAGAWSSSRVGARVLEVAPALEAPPDAEAPFALALDAANLRALRGDPLDLADEGRDFLGFGAELGEIEAGAPVVEDELRAVAQCFPSAEQHLHLGHEATLERLRAVADRSEESSSRPRYRVMHLVARALPGIGAARLALADAEGRTVELDLGALTEDGTPCLPLADLVVLSLFTRGPACDPEQLLPWVRVLLERGARAVLIGARPPERDETARRELGHFYAALAEGEDAASAWARSRHRGGDENAEARGIDADGRDAPIFSLWGDGLLHSRGWSPPDLAVLAPEAVKRPWWIYFVTALVLPAVVFLIFRRLSTGTVRARLAP